MILLSMVLALGLERAQARLSLFAWCCSRRWGRSAR